MILVDSIAPKSSNSARRRATQGDGDRHYTFSPGILYRAFYHPLCSDPDAPRLHLFSFSFYPDTSQLLLPAHATGSVPNQLATPKDAPTSYYRWCRHWRSHYGFCTTSSRLGGSRGSYRRLSFYCHIDLHSELLRLAADPTAEGIPVKLRLGAEVVEATPAGTVTLRDGAVPRC